MSSTITQRVTLLTLIVSKKIAVLKFLPCRTIIQPAGQPNTDGFTDSHFSRVIWDNKVGDTNQNQQEDRQQVILAYP